MTSMRPSVRGRQSNVDSRIVGRCGFAGLADHTGLGHSQCDRWMSFHVLWKRSGTDFYAGIVPRRMKPRFMGDAERTGTDLIRLAAREMHADLSELVHHPSQTAVREATFISNHRITATNVGVRAREEDLLDVGRWIPKRWLKIIALLVQRYGMKAVNDFFAELGIAESESIHATVAFEKRDTQRADGVPDSDRCDLIDRNEICGFQRLFRKEPRQVTGHFPELGNLRFWPRVLAILVPGLGPGSIGKLLIYRERWRQNPFRCDEPG